MREKVDITTIYVEDCVDCGREFRVWVENPLPQCGDCGTKEALRKYKEESEFLIGGVIVDFKVQDCGEFVWVKILVDGKSYWLTADRDVVDCVCYISCNDVLEE